MAGMTRDDVMRQTLAHKVRVGDLLARCLADLTRRAIHHDDSKFSADEFEAFAEATPQLAGLTYGSEEYKAALRTIKPAIQRHYATNRHHPEHFRWRCAVCGGAWSDEQVIWAENPDLTDRRFCPRCMPPTGSIIHETELFEDQSHGINGMTLLDLLEMLCDWKAATERHDDGSLEKSFEHNRERFGISPQLETVLKNTAKEMGLL